MTTCVYSYEIPDLSRPIVHATKMSPSGELRPFVPQPATPQEIIGRQIDEIITYAGTYGMGGPGFFGLRLGEDWLIIALWGAASWMTCRGRLVEDWHFDSSGRPEPWVNATDGLDLLNRALAGQTVETIEIAPRAMHIVISGGFDLTIAEDPRERPAFAGNGQPRAFAPEDDLRRAVFLSPTTELWV